ncbi:hypothetical protein [Bradyrhizobium sp. NBAIM01]|uniref:hypothetical protein n=1 Tax=Bradyrhizobium sp. NBAIM01 TaxID=2793818 RepID=UPI001CD68F7F|nr:hypothetical protein [Bradyrhizobium sp. NBAIM01]MCA1514554.1 hypothetical protein [Bradyrhizobium sp. NBAIM01]
MSVAAADLGGLTESNCCAACNGDRCVISGQAYCAHPHKGGLHHHQLRSDQGAMRRAQTAREMLMRSATELQIARDKL